MFGLARSIATATAGPHALEDRLGRCAEVLVRELELSSCGIWSAQPETDLPRLARAAQAGSPLAVETLEASDEVRRAFENADPEADAAEHTLLFFESTQADGASWVALPLRSRGSTLGVLAVQASRPLEDDDRVALVTASGQLALMLDAARVEREREQFRNFLVSVVGHDLRNPLNALSIGAHLVSVSDDVPEATVRVARNLQTSIQRMGRMVTQLLDVVDLRGGTGESLSIQTAWGDLRQACIRALREHRERFPQAEVLESYSGVTTGHWDVERLTQLLATLLGNAHQHGDPGKPVKLEVVRRGDAVLLQVHSTGPPIPPHRQTEILDPFRTAGKIGGAGRDALGLGLYVALQIARAHGGDLSVSSSEEEGTTFSVQLPADSQGT